MFLPEHRRVLECEMVPNCVTVAIPEMILLCARQVLGRESNILEEEEVRSSVEVNAKAVERTVVRKRLDVWKVQEGLPPMSRLQPHSLYHLGILFGEMRPFQETRSIPENQWSWEMVGNTE